MTYRLDKLMQLAHDFRRNLNMTMSDAMKQAWKVFKLNKALKTNSVVKFSFMKADGSLREAKGTLVGVEDKIQGTKQSSPKVQVYFDLDANGFRSFRKERLVENNLN